MKGGDSGEEGEEGDEEWSGSEGEKEEGEYAGSEESGEEDAGAGGGSGHGSSGMSRSSHESFEYGYSYGRRPRTTSTSNSHSAHLSISNPPKSTPTPPTDPKTKTKTLASLYTLLTFSTSHILEDEFPISWYHLRPYELIEMHPAGGVISLPRVVMSEYVMPYFEARVKALRVVTPGDGADRGGGGGKKIQKGRKGREGDLASSGGSGRMGKDKKGAGKTGKAVGSQGKKDVVWKDRWVVIHKGMLNLCKYRMVRSPPSSLFFHYFKFTLLFVCFSGPESNACNPVIEINGSRRV